MSKKLIIGKVGFTPRGEYDAATTYARIDVVTYNGNTYWSKVDGNLGNEPSADSEWWGVLIDTGEAKSATELANAAAKRAETATETTTALATSVQAAEEARVTAEENRAAAEKERETKVASAIENADTSAENAQTATTNADIATTNANKAADEAEKINVSLADNVISITNRSGEEKTIAVPDADDEDIVKGSNGKLSLKDRGTENGRGYVILRKNKSFAEQVTKTDTTYEIRYDFDLNGEAVTMPENATLNFVGGSLKNGTVEGDGLEAVGDIKNTVEAKVFHKGVNMEKTYPLVASQIGMVQSDSTSGFNDGILDALIAKGDVSLTLDGTYTFSKSHTLQNSVAISGGALIYKTTLFNDIAAGSSIAFKDVDITSDANTLVTKSAIDFTFGSVLFDGCTIKNCSILRLYGADVSYETTPHGLSSFVVTNCDIDVESTFAILNDVCIADKCEFSHNTVKNMVYSLVFLGTTNEYTNTPIIDECADIYFVGNNITGAVSKNNNGYNTPLLGDGQNRIFYRDNVLTNIISVADKSVSYDCYGSVDKYYFENNICTNIVNLPISGTAPETPPEIFKSKAAGSLRFAKNNIWRVDFDVCRELCKEAGVEWTDEQFDNLRDIALFGYVAQIDNLTFLNNTIEVKNGALRLRASSFPVVNATFENNILNIDKASEKGRTLLPCWNKATKNVSICGNTINVTDGYIFLFTTPDFDTTSMSYMDGSCTVKLRNNVFNKTFFAEPFKTKFISENNTIIDKSDYALPNNSMYTMPAEGNGYYETYIAGNGNTVSLKIRNGAHCKIGVLANYSEENTNYYIALFVYESYDFIVRLPHAVLRYKLRIEDGVISLYDEWDNLLLSGKYTSVYKCDYCEIVVNTKSSPAIQFYNLKKYEFSVEVAPAAKNIIAAANTDKYSAGEYRYDKTLGKAIWWNGTTWVDNDGNPADAKTTGTTDERPTGVKMGYMYKDTTLGKLIVWDGSAWVNMDGTALS